MIVILDCLKKGYIHVYMYVCIYIYMYVCVYIYIHVSVHMNITTYARYHSNGRKWKGIK